MGQELYQAPHAWDATRLASIMACKRRFYFGHVKQLTAAGGGWSVDLEFGTAWHESIRRFDGARVEGQAPQDALHLAIKRALELTAEWPTPLCSPAKNRASLIRGLVWYAEQFGDGILRPMLVDGKPALEVGFEFPLWPDAASEKHRQIVLCGNMDGIVEFGGETWVLERKTTGSALSSFYWNKFDPNVQVDVYCLAAKMLWPDHRIQGVLLEAMQTGAGFARFERRQFRRSEGRLQETLRAVRQTVLEAGEIGLERLLDYPNFTGCMNPGPCKFRAICQADPSVRDWTIRTQFEPKAKPWNPLAAEESRDLPEVEA